MASDWHGDDFFTQVADRVTGGIGTAAEEIRDGLKVLIGIQGPPRSRPGEAPHRDTGDLQASVTTDGPYTSGDVVYAGIGTALQYGYDLELGIGVAARPWLSRGLIGAGEIIVSNINANAGVPF